MQKEGYFFKKPCVTLRDETEWVELVQLSINALTPIAKSGILHTVENIQRSQLDFSPAFYSGGKASPRIAEKLAKG